MFSLTNGRVSRCALSYVLLLQVQFDEWQDVKMCSILINDDSTYEGPEQFYVELFSPTYALLGDVTAASVTIMDEEDGEWQLSYGVAPN